MAARRDTSSSDDARALSMRTYSVVLIDDDPMVRGWVRLSLQGTEFRVVGEGATNAEALDMLQRRNPDMVLLDYHLKDVTGTQLLRELREHGHLAAVVMMTAHDEAGFNETAREAGAQGTVLKTGRPDELVEALRRTSAGIEAFDVRYPRREAGRAPLSPRERAVLQLVARGATNREAAAELDVTPETVKTLLGRCYAKLGVRRRAEAVAVASELGLL
jgi:DNA-binding NarL/FixJ family response regulator